MSTQEEIRNLHAEWMLAWDKQPGEPPFELRRKFDRFYAWDADGVVLYDTFAPQHRVARSADEYGTFWAAPFTAMRSARHCVLDIPEVLVDGGLAASTMEFAALLEASDGSIAGVRARSSIVWRRTRDGWRIVHEHNSARSVDAQDLAPFFDGSQAASRP